MAYHTLSCAVALQILLYFVGQSASETHADGTTNATDSTPSEIKASDDLTQESVLAKLPGKSVSCVAALVAQSASCVTMFLVPIAIPTSY